MRNAGMGEVGGRAAGPGRQCSVVGDVLSTGTPGRSMHETMAGSVGRKLGAMCLVVDPGRLEASETRSAPWLGGTDSLLLVANLGRCQLVVPICGENSEHRWSQTYLVVTTVTVVRRAKLSEGMTD